ncbi:ABC transporter permease [Fibrisoma montanum]|uniref:ABC transporter permease n=1 Tax=Fibrisoma montanum TaxID=2305895 RepID=A0A418LVH0_9BACT|nr:ABC transporter permease [Fibrisoma montanum]RIV17264.1 ABC transporter permease [Fibrisoma montanum]
MLKSYFTTAFRALKRNWNYTVINVVGLTFGLACCLLLFMAIRYELSYDRHNANADRTYRLVGHYTNGTTDGFNVGIQLPALAALRNDFPELKQHITLTHEISDVVIRTGNSATGKFKEGRGLVSFVEPEYFSIFDYGWKQGNAQTALKNPNTVVLSERMARKYFGNTDPMGKTIRVENRLDFTVTGVVDNPPATTSVPFEVLLSFASLKQYGAYTGWDDWQSTYSGAQVYLTLPSSSVDQELAARQMGAKLVAFGKKYLRPDDAANFKFELQPLTEIHYDKETGNYANRTVSRQTIWAMALIGLFILITACVNFINLATALAIRRSKEVGVRKVMGSSRGQLIRQFLGETGLLTTIAVVLALVVAYLALPSVAKLLDIQVDALTLVDPAVIGFLIVLAVFTTVLAGFYPSLVLSGYQPVLALKGRSASGKLGGSGNKQLTLRRSLIIVQFAISQMLIIGTIIAYSQMQHFRSADLGYRKDAVLTVPIPERKPGQLENLRARLASLPHVESLSYGISIPSANGNWSTSIRFENADKEADFSVVMRPADTSYFRTYGLQLIAGRMYLPADTMREFVVNESLARKLGFSDPKQIIGKTITLGGTQEKKPIVGVVKDFSTYSLHRKTAPSLLTSFRDTYNTLGIQFDARQGGTEAISRLVRTVEQSWEATFPDFVFKYEFLDESIDNFYRNEERLFSVFRLLAGIAIFIGCLGLYGVVAFMVESRTKEVGIRKALGASTAHIFSIFSVDFLKLVLIALVVASPVAWYVMSGWLKDFEYKISIEWWMFALAGLLAVVVALITVSFQSIRAAMLNPVKSLRAE